MPDRGYVPAYIRDMFGAALEYGVTHDEWWEWFVTEHADQFLWRERDGGRWEQLDAQARATWILDQLASSTAAVPGHLLALSGFEPGQTYAELARRLRMGIPDAVPARGAAEAGDAAQVSVHITIPHALMEQLTVTCDRMGITWDEAICHALRDWLR